jgi:hypothetical protein
MWRNWRTLSGCIAVIIASQNMQTMRISGIGKLVTVDECKVMAIAEPGVTLLPYGFQ